MKNKSLFFFIEGLSNKGGTERIAITLANRCIKEGYKVHFISLENITNYAYKINPLISIHSLSRKWNKRITAIWKLRTIIKKYQPDYIINVGMPMGQISIPASLGLKTRIINWEHFNLYAGSKLGYYWRLLAAKLAYATVVLTQKDKQNYLKKVNANILNIPNFTDNFIDVISPLDSNIILTIGRLAPQKGYDMLIEAWKIVSYNNPDWKLYIVGDGKDEQMLKKQAKILSISDSIHFIPATNNIECYFKKASIYVMSSRFEGLPMVLIEAKMCGIPCVSFICPNGPDEIIQHNIDGILVEYGNIEHLATAIITLINNRNKICEYGMAGKKDALTKYTSNAVINQWNNLFI